MGMNMGMSTDLKEAGIKVRSDVKFAEIALNSPFLVRPIGIVWRKNQVLSGSARLLISAIEDICRKDGARQPQASAKAKLSGAKPSGRRPARG